MSSPPSDREPRGRQPFERWRRLMLAGALVLLVVALLQAAMSTDLPRWLLFGGNGLGFVLLATGFGLRMKDRGIR